MTKSSLGEFRAYLEELFWVRGVPEGGLGAHGLPVAAGVPVEGGVPDAEGDPEEGRVADLAEEQSQLPPLLVEILAGGDSDRAQHLGCKCSVVDVSFLKTLI